MTKIERLAAPEAAEPATDLLHLVEMPADVYRNHEDSPPRHAADRTPHGVKHFPYARLDRATVRRVRRLGPALSPLTTRQIYPDEDSAAGAVHF